MVLIDKFKIYQPILDTSQFWLQAKKDYVLLENNGTDENIEIHISFNTYWSWKYMIQTQFQSTSQIYDQFGMGVGNNLEELKEIFLENNIYFVALTMVVSMLHSICEFLVLKNGCFIFQKIK